MAPAAFIECYRTSGAKNYVHANRVFMTMSHSGEESQANWTDRLRLENIAGNLGGRQWICSSLAVHLTVFRAPAPPCRLISWGGTFHLSQPTLGSVRPPASVWFLGAHLTGKLQRISSYCLISQVRTKSALRTELSSVGIREILLRMSQWDLPRTRGGWLVKDPEPGNF